MISMLKTVASLVTLTMMSCVTVPTDAPQAFHDAKSALDKADEENVDELLPNTMESANKDFDSALTLWKDAEDLETKAEILEQRSDATEQVSDVGSLVMGATDLNRNIKQWDENFESLEGEYSISGLLGEIKSLKKDLAVTDEEGIIESPFAKLQDFRINSAVAYFDTEKFNLDPYYEAAISEVAGLMRLDNNLVVTVSGYTDPRGPEKYNEWLSSERAKAVANVLKQGGIEDERIHMASMGEKLAHFQRGSSKMQLERRVDLTITFGSGETSM